MTSGGKILYVTTREKRKTMAIHVLPDMSIVVKSPMVATDKEIDDFINRKKSWIIKQLNYFKQFQKEKTIIESGTEFIYLGKQLQIIIKKAQTVKEYVELENTKLVIYSLFPNKVDRNKDIFNNWINTQIEKHFSLALKRCIKRFPNMVLPVLRTRDMSKRWGSFTRQNTIILNPKLITVPKECIDYVVVHELCHFYHADHSSSFYSLLGVKLPNWQKIKDKLEKFSTFQID